MRELVMSRLRAAVASVMTPADIERDRDRVAMSEWRESPFAKDDAARLLIVRHESGDATLIQCTASQHQQDDDDINTTHVITMDRAELAWLAGEARQ